MKQQTDVIVCVGTGGVGKTTVSSAVGVRAAIKGKRALVMTIDPAKRLAQSMGMKELKNTPTDITDIIRRSGTGKISGRIDAMMLETKATFNNLIKRYARSADKANTILNNPYYQYVSGELAGSEDYMAMEKLYEIENEYDYDLIVVDTPPARHAINFLTAPNRLIQLISSGVLKWLIKPSTLLSSFGLNMLNKAPEKMIKILNNYVGLEIVQELTDFFTEFEDLYDGFKSRAKDVKTLLSSKKVNFYMVTIPTMDAIDESVYFYSIMKDFDINFHGFIINKVHPYFYYDDTVRANTEQLKNKLNIDDQLRLLLEGTLNMEKRAMEDERLIQYLKTKIKSSKLLYLPLYLILDKDLTDPLILVEFSKELDRIVQ